MDDMNSYLFAIAGREIRLEDLSRQQVTEIAKTLEEPHLLGMAQYQKRLGYSIDFVGRFMQTPISPANSSLVYTLPFAISNMSHNESTETFTAVSLDGMGQGKLDGRFNGNNISFSKQYISEFIGFDGIIKYSGSSQDSGRTYRGTWSFDSRGGNLNPFGDFSMARVQDEALFFDTLQRVCRDEL